MNGKLLLIQPDLQNWEILEQVTKIDKQAFQSDGISVFNMAQFARSGSLYCFMSEEFVVGEAVLSRNIKDSGAVLFAFAVESSMQKRGFGVAMLKMLINECKKSGITYLELTMNPDNIATRKLYIDKFKFVKLSELAAHPEKGEPRWLMRLDIL